MLSVYLCNFFVLYALRIVSKERCELVCLRTSYVAIQYSESFAYVRAYLITSEFSIMWHFHYCFGTRPMTVRACSTDPIRTESLLPLAKPSGRIILFATVQFLIHFVNWLQQRLGWATCRTDIPSFRPAVACFQWKEVQAVLRVAWILSSLAGLDLQQISRQHLDPKSTSPH